jgi:hypothetical protein
MDTDSILSPYCDVSGNCLLSREKANGGHNRPRMSQKFCKMIGVPWIPFTRSESISRWVFFNHHPDVDRQYNVIASCCNKMCVKAEHQRLGLMNMKGFVFHE